MDSSEAVRLGIVTGPAVPALTDDGQRVRAALEERGFDAEAVVWTDASIEWSRFDVLLVRSCWEYYARRDAFHRWLRTVTDAGVTLLNPREVVEWNAHKFYLRDLEDSGVDLLPTRFVPADADVDLDDVLAEAEWNDAVVKPAVGTSSHGVRRVTVPVTDADRAQFAAALEGGDVLVQAFAPEIRDGELSLVFFGGRFSHAVRSVPAEDDFRAHPDHGNTLEPASPTGTVRGTAASVLETAAERCGVAREDLVYARVDGLVRDGGFQLMELELVEPYLSLSLGDGATARFVDAIEAAVAQAASASTPTEWGAVDD